MFHKAVWQHARSGRIFNNLLTANLPKNPAVKKIWKSVMIWRNYGHELVTSLFWPALYVSVTSYDCFVRLTHAWFFSYLVPVGNFVFCSESFVNWISAQNRRLFQWVSKYNYVFVITRQTSAMHNIWYRTSQLIINWISDSGLCYLVVHVFINLELTDGRIAYIAC